MVRFLFHNMKKAQKPAAKAGKLVNYPKTRLIGCEETPHTFMFGLTLENARTLRAVEREGMPLDVFANSAIGEYRRGQPLRDAQMNRQWMRSFFDWLDSAEGGEITMGIRMKLGPLEWMALHSEAKKRKVSIDALCSAIVGTCAFELSNGTELDGEVEGRLPSTNTEAKR